MYLHVWHVSFELWNPLPYNQCFSSFNIIFPKLFALGIMGGYFTQLVKLVLLALRVPWCIYKLTPNWMRFPRHEMWIILRDTRSLWSFSTRMKSRAANSKNLWQVQRRYAPEHGMCLIQYFCPRENSRSPAAPYTYYIFYLGVRHFINHCQHQ